MAEPKPTITVITATYNSASVIGPLIESLRSQNDLRFEWVVQDGGSEDGTAELIRGAALPFPVDVKSEPDSGIYQAFNRAIERARGEYLLFLGADDRLASPEVIARLADRIAERAGEAALLLGEATMGDRRRFRSSLGWKCLLVNTVHHQGALYARSVFNDFRYDEAIPVIADYELNVRLYRAGATAIETGVLIAACGDEGVSQTSDERQLYRAMHAVRRRHVSPVISWAALLVGLANVRRRRVRLGRS